MTTKFANRPAPRKRPWICKRSPPCLPPPPVPPSLLCSFYLERRQPPLTPVTIAGSLNILRVGPANYYSAVWDQPPDNFIPDFTYDLTTATGRVEANWAVGIVGDHGYFSVEAINPPPLLYYFSAHLQADIYTWYAQILITS